MSDDGGNFCYKEDAHKLAVREVNSRKLIYIDLDDCNISKIPEWAEVVSVSKSSGGGCHVLVSVSAPNIPCIEPVLEAYLGGDIMRAKLDFIRCANGIPYHYGFFDIKGIRSKGVGCQLQYRY